MYQDLGARKGRLKAKVKASWAWLVDTYHALAAATKDMFGLGG
jgi:hypothetical protein